MNPDADQQWVKQKIFGVIYVADDLVLGESRTFDEKFGSLQDAIKFCRKNHKKMSEIHFYEEMVDVFVIKD